MEQSLFSNSTTVSSSRILYTPSFFARTSLLHMQETGVLRALRQHKSRRSNLSSYLFFMVIEGAGELEYRGVVYKLSKDDCVFINCQMPYSHSTSKDLWMLKWVHFYSPNMATVYEKYLSRGGKPVFHTNMPGNYKKILDDLYVVAGSSSHVRDMEINQLLSGLLVLLMKDSWNPDQVEAKGKGSRVQNIKEYLDNHYNERITLDDLAEKFFINKFYLSEMFKEQYGVPVNEYLISVRITRSKELLRFTDKTMSEIAMDCGINGAAYFSRVFKKIEGVTPNQYRRMW